ncbi:MAG: hypothetical protein ACLTKG_07200 [Collinsella intestinalis]
MHGERREADEIFDPWDFLTRIDVVFDRLSVSPSRSRRTRASPIRMRWRPPTATGGRRCAASPAVGNGDD